MNHDLQELNEQLKEEIIKRQQTEEALRDSDALYRGLFDGSPDAILLADPETGIILDANAAASRLLGRPHAEIIGLHQSSIHPPHREAFSRNAFSLHVKETSRGEDSHPIENTVRRPDGSEVSIEVMAQLVTIGGKKILQGVFRDITRRKQAEDDLHTSEERLLQAVGVAHIGIFDYDHMTGSLHWTPELREICGCSHDEIITYPVFLDLIYPHDKTRILSALQRANDPSGIGLFGEEFRITRRDGTVRWLTVRAKSFFGVDANGHPRPRRSVGAVLDITDSKQAVEEKEKLQAQFVQAQKMESVGRLAGGVAHDFNNMLSVILGHSDMALRKVDAPSRLRRDLEQIHKAARHSADLTKQLLAFARKQTITPLVLNLNDSIEGMLKMLHRLMGEDIDVAWHPAASLWAVKIDPAQIEQILANLLVNARDAINDQGRVSIETENTVLDEAYCEAHAGFKPGEYVTLAVSDNGSGMDRPTLAHIFEPFFTTKGVGKGTGLGLATVYGIVKQNEGFINVYSEPGRGTTFRIYLPRVISEKAATVKGHIPARPQGGTETILLVEDEPMILELSRLWLEELGYQVIAASSPSEAIRRAGEHEGMIHLVMTDVVLPEMNGRELVKRLLARYPNVKSLFMSGYTADVIAHHGILEEGIHFIPKPFTIDGLAVKVRKALE